MRAPPAECNSALRLGGAPSYQFTTTNYQLSSAVCGLMASLVVINCSLLILPFPSRRVQVGGQSKAMLKLRWCFLGGSLRSPPAEYNSALRRG